MSKGISAGVSPVFLLLLFGSINFGFARSPCPQYFHYMKDEIDGKIWARIEVPRAPKNVALHLRVRLSVAIALPTKYVGRLELATSKSEAVKAVYQGRPLLYDLHFPVRNPIPILTEMTFNGERYCTGSRARGPIVTTIYLEHTLYPPGVIALSDDEPTSKDPDFLDIPPNRPGINFSPDPTEQSSPDTFLSPDGNDPTFLNVEKPILDGNKADLLDNYKKICGRVNTAGVNYLIANGDRTSPGQWPWLAAIFVAKIEFEFQCAGSLITDKHIITAAHCKFHKGIDVPASAFIVSLGRYHLHEWREQGSQSLEVLKFRGHPDYGNPFSADADIALITLRKKVQFTPKIQPLCLWNEPSTLERIVRLSGYVVGWGKDEDGHQHLKEPRMAVAPIVSQEDCLRSNAAFIPSTSNRTFCAGRRDGSGPCNGDSGSGLVLLDQNTGRYHLRGIVSLSLLDKERKSCDLSQYVVYADSAKFFNWIKSQIHY
ncbi:serine protease gd-like isoform X2 [Venturia canescens]|nr:serine protease gd-like isoform X2 [Venturia canescens]XP_043267090.1 serine protease gd-like isoform X2 [Venturia canescens]XP_043267091.1 serine protease gd-like isoform X2 [Venturia canescens]XP_043267092.1 serine protease gd-like isoform X2 [Venturia canescens]